MEVVSFENYVPPARFDAVSWTSAQIEESASEDGAWTVLEIVPISIDADPADPQARDFTTSLGTGPGLWYRVLFLDAASNSSEPTLPSQNIVTTAIIDADPYAAVSELQAKLKLRDPNSLQMAEMLRVLSAAAGEINSEIGRVNSELSGWEVALAAEVNLERAVEHWEQMTSPFGIVGLGAVIGGPTHTATDSWNRHANKLAPLKTSWGLA
jgi:hypothetical protein